jgi:hypothetical protein
MSQVPIAIATATKWDVRGGVMAALGFGIVGGVSAALGVLLLSIAAHWNDPTFQKDFAAGHIWSLEIAIFPMVASSAVLAAAGWLRYGIRPPLRFVLALGTVTFGTICIWMWLSAAAISAGRVKSISTELITPAEFFLLTTPPAVVALLATIWSTR